MSPTSRVACRGRKGGLEMRRLHAGNNHDRSKPRPLVLSDSSLYTGTPGPLRRWGPPEAEWLALTLVNGSEVVEGRNGRAGFHRDPGSPENTAPCDPRDRRLPWRPPTGSWVTLATGDAGMTQGRLGDSTGFGGSEWHSRLGWDDAVERSGWDHPEPEGCDMGHRVSARGGGSRGGICPQGGLQINAVPGPNSVNKSLCSARSWGGVLCAQVFPR